MASATFKIEGDVNVEITITENGDGTLTFDINVLDETGSIGDLNALFFDMVSTDENTSDADLINSLTVTGDDVTGVELKDDGVTKIDSFTNMNGEVVQEYGKFDGGIQFGTSGIAKDDIQSTSFTLSSELMDLSLENFSLQDFGIRLTSVGEADGAREDSLKLGGESDEYDGGGGGTGGPDPSVTDDYMTVLESETFTPPFAPDPSATDVLDGGATSLLANDVEQFEIIAANGTAAPGDVIVGTNGGIAKINADGSVDFSSFNLDGVNEFAYLAADETAQTTFTYTTEGGLEATLFVTVIGIEGDGGGGDPGGPGFG